MSKVRIREFFAGGNTSLGFYSFFNHILEQGEALRIFILKGGPGTGKSTFMRKIANRMMDRDYSLEYIHCASDPDSLDALVIPKIKVALIDGTSPHVVDPKNPGAVDEIINLGEFWDDSGIHKHKNEIIELSREKSNLFTRAYRYIRAAAEIQEDSSAILEQALDKGRLYCEIHRILDDLSLCSKTSSKEGKQRCLFASAITPEGLVNHLKTILTTQKIYTIRGSTGMGTEKIIEAVRTAAVERGYFVENFYCALNPSKIEHLIIPVLDVSFTTSNEFHNVDITPWEEIDMNKFLDGSKMQMNNCTLEYNASIFNNLINRAVETLGDARAVHEKLEQYYVSNMDYKEVEKCFESTVDRIFSYV